LASDLLFPTGGFLGNFPVGFSVRTQVEQDQRLQVWKRDTVAAKPIVGCGSWNAWQCPEKVGGGESSEVVMK